MKINAYIFKKTLSRGSALAVFFVLIAGCDTGGTSGNPDAAPFVPPPIYWETPTPDFTFDPDRPVVTLTGDKVIILSMGEEFNDPGASATDAQDGNLTASITVDNQLDSTQAGDYFVRYRVTDSSDKDAIDAVRIVRIVDDSPVDISPRPVGSTQSHLGYVEYLPDDYGLDPQRKHPIIIYNHGNGANVEFSGNDPLGALNTLLQNAGPPLLLSAGKWDPDLPFILLAPQFGNAQNVDVPARIDAFVDYAINTYAVDESQIYFTGWSQGGFLSMLYAVEHSDRVAAVISVSGGIPADENQLPDNFCDIENVPVWLFHGDQDDIVSVESSIRSVDLIRNNCQPTVAPRLTVFEGKDHVIHHSVFNLSSMEGGTLGSVSDPAYDAYDQNLYEWLLSFDLDDR